MHQEGFEFYCALISTVLYSFLLRFSCLLFGYILSSGLFCQFRFLILGVFYFFLFHWTFIWFAFCVFLLFRCFLVFHALPLSEFPFVDLFCWFCTVWFISINFSGLICFEQELLKIFSLYVFNFFMLFVFLCFCLLIVLVFSVSETFYFFMLFCCMIFTFQPWAFQLLDRKFNFSEMYALSPIFPPASLKIFFFKFLH